MSNITIGSISGSGNITGDNNTVSVIPATASENRTILATALQQNDLDTFFQTLQEIFASIPYNAKVTEGYFHSNIHVILKFLGFNIQSEVGTNVGRIDAVLDTQQRIYIFEFKKDSAAVAIEQILQKEYYQMYQTTSKKLILVGVALDYSKRNISGWKVMPAN